MIIILYQTRIPGIESIEKAFKPTMHDLKIDIAKLYDQLVRGMSVVGDTTMHSKCV